MVDCSSVRLDKQVSEVSTQLRRIIPQVHSRFKQSFAHKTLNLLNTHNDEEEEGKPMKTLTQLQMCIKSHQSLSPLVSRVSLSDVNDSFLSAPVPIDQKTRRHPNKIAKEQCSIA